MADTKNDRLLLTPDERKVMYRGRFTYNQAALYLGIGKDLVAAYVKDGQMRCNEVNGKKLIPKFECDRFMASGLR